MYALDKHIGCEYIIKGNKLKKIFALILLIVIFIVVVIFTNKKVDYELHDKFPLGI